MKRQLEQLEKLQELDVKIFKIERQKEEFPMQIEELQAELKKVNDKKAELDKTKAVINAERHEKGRELDLDRIRMKNLTNKEAQVTNQKEYELYMKELSGLEEEIKQHEGELKGINEKVAGIDKEIEKVDKNVKAIADKVGALEASASKKEKEIDGQLDSLYEAREKIEDALDERLLDHYITVSDNAPDGVGMAYAKEGVCLMCFMTIPPQMYNELLKGESMHVCPHCRRILVYREELPEWAIKKDK